MDILVVDGMGRGGAVVGAATTVGVVAGAMITAGMAVGVNTEGGMINRSKPFSG